MPHPTEGTLDAATQRRAANVTDEERPMRRFTALGRKLYVQVLVGITLGAAIGVVDPGMATSFKPLGDVFIKAIRIVVVPIIFTTIVVGIAKTGDLRQIARLDVRAIVYFEVISTLALLVGMAVGNLWPIGSSINADPQALDPKALADFVNASPPPSLTGFLLNIVPSTFLDPFIKGKTLQILFVAVLFALALCHDLERTKPLVELLERISVALFGMVGIIMYFAPIGAFGAMAFTIGKYGIRTAFDLGQLVLAVYLVSILFVIVVLGLVLRLSGFNIWNVLAYFKDEILLVFAATSAETMIPRSMGKTRTTGVQQGRGRIGDAYRLFFQHGRHRDLYEHRHFVLGTRRERASNRDRTMHRLARDAVYIEGRGRRRWGLVCRAGSHIAGGQPCAGG
jgi:aerobic C4-dicarboxylate transport protein